MAEMKWEILGLLQVSPVELKVTVSAHKSWPADRSPWRIDSRLRTFWSPAERDELEAGNHILGP